MRVLVVGAGATGGYFGGRLAEAGRDVTFLVRPERAAQLRSGGLVINSPNGDLRLAPKLVTVGELTDSYDLVLLTVKSYALEQAVEDIAPAVGLETAILPVLNGLRHVELLAGHFGDQRVLGGVCQVTTTLDPDGGIRQLGGRQELVHGVCRAPGPARVHEIDAELRDAGFTVRRSEDIRQEMWEKWVYVAAVGAVTCLMRGLIGEVVAAPGGRAFAERVVAECVAVAAASGHPVGEAARSRMLATVTEAGADTASSLYRDLRRGGPVEADHILGDLAARAAERGVEVPLIGLAYTHLRVYQGAPRRSG
ncbi:ketopantoate reductase family protein [Kitasatospora sp. MAP5-34]|uniref:ketopantoate reductase family protein n=1 Tax=Kitasatospora sp. MAP5-34 TaxID=3035102 RepID=UPI002476506F|nr:ketopantoate reductase family protein [Kitasatospora sp. MAP5-34]MDH6574602.1 2-dehydropantoate 2-reductase [Kitasatospora sp. MAP5-34]